MTQILFLLSYLIHNDYTVGHRS